MLHLGPNASLQLGETACLRDGWVCFKSPMFDPSAIKKYLKIDLLTCVCTKLIIDPQKCSICPSLTQISF